MKQQSTCCQCQEQAQRRVNVEEFGFFSLCDNEQCKAELWRELMREELLPHKQDEHKIQFQGISSMGERIVILVSVLGFGQLIIILIIILIKIWLLNSF